MRDALNPDGNPSPRGVGDNNRDGKGRQEVDKVFQEYKGSQQNPRMDERETVPFNIDNKRWHL